MVAIVLPSRGLIHSRTVEAVLNMDLPSSTAFYFSHDRPIPDCFNVPIQRALDEGAKAVMILEEDVIPPNDAFQKLSEALWGGADIAFYDYPLDDPETRTTQHLGDKLSSGTGCIMFKRRALEFLYPFRTTQLYDRDLEPIRELSPEEGMKQYGKHDIDLFVRAQKAGMVIQQVGNAKHCRVRAYGEQRINRGQHIIEVLN